MSTLIPSRTTSADRFTPLYVRIQERIRAAIADGTMAAGDRVWSEAELAREYKTTRSTVRQALAKLEFEGLIVRHVGRGSFVAERTTVRSPIDSRFSMSFEEQVAQSGRIVTYRSPTLELMMPPQPFAETLGLEPHTLAFKLKRVRVIDGRPVCLEVRYMPREIGERVTGEMLASRSAQSFVGDIIGENIPTIVVSVTAELAQGSVASLLNVSEGSPLLVRKNSHYASSGAVVQCGRSLFVGDVSTDYVLGRPPPHPPK
ncbi:GntR family transcriptional regulator [Ancylobacter sp. MQZ15Z-1]|uniref:GntR family transcriptional regulator n=1 Tax=Ancylobacter mangrovi TaxID=2972472 RepID=A0A9X2PJH4_9HYPH|nr:GntR family transcriptional regulator [Ancylobacter mangrovi]MCS0497220.1 GntR family transcriptional regulator [Ancylobacter mangrovi]